MGISSSFLVDLGHALAHRHDLRTPADARRERAATTAAVDGRSAQEQAAATSHRARVIAPNAARDGSSPANPAQNDHASGQGGRRG